MRVQGLHHVLLTVRDLPASASFYEQVLGLHRIRDIADDGLAGAKTLFALPDGIVFGVVHHRQGSGEFDEVRPGLDHLAFTVPAAELPQWQQRLAEGDVPYSPPAPSAFGDPLIVLRDPDGIQLQIYGRRD